MQIPELSELKTTPAELLEHRGFLSSAESNLGVDSTTDALVPVHKLENMKPYPGIDYLGMGYDLVHGNPDGDVHTMLDTGFVQPVRKLSYTGVSMTRNNDQLTPDGSYSIPLRSCARSSTVSDVASESK